MTEQETHDVQADSDHMQPLSISQRLGRLQFHHSGKFRIVEFSDIQDGPNVSKDTISLITAALQAARPDIVIFSGNQIAGYEKAYAATYHKRMWKGLPTRLSQEDARRVAADLERTREHVRHTIASITAPLIEAGVPWAITYGNHDFQCGLSNKEIDDICREFEGCMNPAAPTQSSDIDIEKTSVVLPQERVYACEPGTFALPVMAEDTSTVVMGIVLVDSGSYARSGGYGSPSDRALQFLRVLPEQLGPHAKSMVFQHTPIPQFYALLQPVLPNAAHAVEGYRSFSGTYYALDDTKTEPGSYLGEGVSCPDIDSGEFSILRDSGAYFALAAGHDHRNAFWGTVEGIRLYATPTCGFGSYGPVPEKRAARLFEFDIRHPYEPRTQLLEFGDLVGKPSSKKAYVYGMTSASKPESEGVDLLHKPNAFARLVGRLLRRNKL